MDIYLDKLTQKHLEDIHNYTYQKYRSGEIKKRPSRSDVIRTLINGLYDSMKEAGEIE